MVEEIVMADKLIKFYFFYNSKDPTAPVVYCKSTGSRPLTLLSLLLKLFYLGHSFLPFFSLLRYSQVITHLSPHKTY